MLGAAVSFGVMWQKLDGVDKRLVRIENKLDRTPSAVASVGSANETP